MASHNHHMHRNRRIRRSKRQISAYVYLLSDLYSFDRAASRAPFVYRGSSVTNRFQNDFLRPLTCSQLKLITWHDARCIFFSICKIFYATPRTRPPVHAIDRIVHVHLPPQRGQGITAELSLENHWTFCPLRSIKVREN